MEKWMKIFEKVKANSDREVFLFDQPVLKYGKKTDANVVEKYLELFPKTPVANQFFDNVLNNLGDSFDDYYIVKQPSGEPYLLTYFAEKWSQNNKSKKPIFTGCRNYHKDIFNLFCPNVCFQNLAPDIYKNYYTFYLSRPVYHYKNKRFFIYINRPFFKNMHKKLNAGEKVHYFDEILKQYNIDKKTISYAEPNITEEIKRSAFEKVKGLNIENFVIICPEANTIKSIPKEFWTELIKGIKAKGYDIYLNQVKRMGVFYDNRNFATLTFPEMFALAQKSKGIIGLRSGLIEFLSRSNVKIDAIYNEMTLWNTTAKNEMNSHTMYNLPAVNSELICEYCIENNNEKDILNRILERY